MEVNAFGKRTSVSQLPLPVVGSGVAHVVKRRGGGHSVGSFVAVLHEVGLLAPDDLHYFF
jgi:hypothetical protein